jgi:O-antigen/teichoic acid export membrane protein
MKRSNVSRSIFITFVAQLVLYGQGLIVMPIAIKLAGESVYGSYVLILNMLTTAYGLSSLGAGYNFRRRLSSTANPQARRALFEPQFSFQTLNLTILSGLALIGGAWLQQRLFGTAVHLDPWVVPVWFLAYMANSQVADYFRYSLRFVHFNLIGAYPMLFVGFVALYAFITHGISLNALMLMQIAAYAIVTMPLLWIMLRETGILRFRLPWASLRADIAVGYPLTLEFITDLLMAYGDRYIILLYLTVADVGRYQPAYQLAALATFFPKVAGVVLPPMLSHYVDNGSEKAARDLVTSFLRLFLMLAIPFAAGVTMIGPSLIALLANPNVAHASRWVGPLIAVATIFNGIGLVAFQIGFVLGLTRTVLNANVVGAATNIALNLTLIYTLRSITVPAFVALVSYIASSAYIAWVLKGIWPIRIQKVPLLKFIAAAAGMAALLYMLGYRPGSVSAAPVSHLLLHITLGVMSYFLLLSAIGGFGRQDMHQLRGIFRKELKISSETS